MFEQYLEDLEMRIDDSVESDLNKQWEDFNFNRFNGQIFSPCRKKNSPSNLQWNPVRVNAALESFEQMAMQQYKTCSDNLAGGSGAPLTVRCNYGVSILPSLFGTETFIMDDKYNTLPTCRPFNQGTGKIKDLIKKGVPDIYGGFGAKVFKMAEYYLKIAAKYPSIGRHVQIYHPDLQGPMDVCELMWGSDIFIDIIDEPQLVHDFLSLITETYIKFMKAWFSIIPGNREMSAHWSIAHRGRIMLRNDSAMNMSPELYSKFILPYDQIIFDEFGGGAIHFCGRGDHYISFMSEMRGLYAINLTQPSYNDLEVVYQNTVDKGIKLIGFSKDAALKAINAGRNLKSNVHC